MKNCELRDSPDNAAKEYHFFARDYAAKMNNLGRSATSEFSLAARPNEASIEMNIATSAFESTRLLDERAHQKVLDFRKD